MTVTCASVVVLKVVKDGRFWLYFEGRAPRFSQKVGVGCEIKTRIKNHSEVFDLSN